MLQSLPMGTGEKPNVKLWDRDFRFLRDLYESRLMTIEQAGLLHFGSYDAAKKRTQKLKAARYIRERVRKISDPSILSLAKAGLEVLLNDGHLEGLPRMGWTVLDRRLRVTDRTIRHEIEVMNVKAAMVAAIAKTERCTVHSFSTWPQLCEFQACRSDGKRVPVEPDGFIQIREKEGDGGRSEHAFFLEVDRSTEVLDVLAQKCHCYLDFYRSGGFAVRNGGAREEYKEIPFRVLLVCKSEARRDNVARRLLENNPPIGTLVWLTTMKEHDDNPLGAIWVRPADYRHFGHEENKNAPVKRGLFDEG